MTTPAELEVSLKQARKAIRQLELLFHQFQLRGKTFQETLTRLQEQVKKWRGKREILLMKEARKKRTLHYQRS